MASTVQAVFAVNADPYITKLSAAERKVSRSGGSAVSPLLLLHRMASIKALQQFWLADTGLAASAFGKPLAGGSTPVSLFDSRSGFREFFHRCRAEIWPGHYILVIR